MSPPLAAESSDRGSGVVVAISATFTAEPLRDTVRFWFEQLGIEGRVEFTPYNQLFQQLLDPASTLACNSRGTNVLLVRFEDWARGGGLAHLDVVVPQLLAGLREAAAVWRVSTILALCPSSPDWLAETDGATAIARLTASVEAGIEPLSGVELVTAGELQDIYPVADAHDPHADELGHVPYGPMFFAALGTILARRIAAHRRPPYKVLALDCDETLWKGVCAEDGPLGVSVDEDHRAVQELARAQRDAGMLLVLCSKNQEDDVLEVFRSHPAMPLRIEDFAARRINWTVKSANLASLAKELGLALDSFVFVDDNAAEAAEVEANCPGVLAVALPSQGAREFLRHLWALDRPKATIEDRARAAMYAHDLERAQFERQALGLEAFLEGLELRVEIAPAVAAELPRLAQLTQRTNQMNFTAVRRSEIDLRDLLRSAALECLSVHASDRFGSYGLVGTMLFREGEDALAIDTFLLSCRALGKGIEHRMLARLAEIALGRELPWLDASFSPTARNQPALEFLRGIEWARETACEGSISFRLSARETAVLRYCPSVLREPGARRPPLPATVPAAVRSAIDYARIATTLRTPRQILEAVQRRGPADVAAEEPSGVAPRSDLERELAALWGELLGQRRVGIHDGFFDLGGHSLLAVQLISRVRQLYAVELSLELVYGGAFTVAALARSIEIARIEQAGPDAYAAALAEIDALSDEEARVLLERERAGATGE